jgi:hypothetical protein
MILNTADVAIDATAAAKYPEEGIFAVWDSIAPVKRPSCSPAVRSVVSMMNLPELNGVEMGGKSGGLACYRVCERVRGRVLSWKFNFALKLVGEEKSNVIVVGAGEGSAQVNLSG